MMEGRTNDHVATGNLPSPELEMRIAEAGAQASASVEAPGLARPEEEAGMGAIDLGGGDGTPGAGEAGAAAGNGDAREGAAPLADAQPEGGEEGTAGRGETAEGASPATDAAEPATAGDPAEQAPALEPAPAPPEQAPAPPEQAPALPEQAPAPPEQAQASPAVPEPAPGGEAAEPSAMAAPAFAELLEQSLERTRPLKPGDRLRAVVQRIDDQFAFLDYGGPSEAVIESRELRDADGNLKLGVGDRIDVNVASVGDQVVVHRLVRKTRDRSALKQAFASATPIEGKVTGTNKGGFDVHVAGFRAFCPISQIDRTFCSDPQAYVGQTLPFKIIEYKEGGRRIVVSRRALIEEDRRKHADETRARLQVGDELEGTVVRLQPFGAFVDIGGLDGLVHVSELRHGRVTDPAQVVGVGQKIRVKIIGIENRGAEKGERISLSAKALEADPWSGVREKLAVGATVQGRVLRLMNYGAFIEVLPGIEGLMHLSEMGGRLHHPREAVSEGSTVEVRILELDPERRRLSLSMRPEGDAAEPDATAGPRLQEGMAVAGTVSSVKPYGVFVRILEPVSGVDGLVPAEETGKPRGTDLAGAFPSGSNLRAKVMRIDDKGRVRLTLRSAEERKAGHEREREHGRGRGGDGPRAGADGGRREPRREARREREVRGDEPAEAERGESKPSPAGGLGIMAKAFKRVLDGR